MILKPWCGYVATPSLPDHAKLGQGALPAWQIHPMTTRRLVLVRHAKAAADGPDLERGLAGRGRADAPAVGRWLADQGLVPDRVVVSPARRARQTWELAAAELTRAPDPVMDERIYSNTAEDLLSVVREVPAAIETLVVVGHNPAIQELAVALDDGRGDHAAHAKLAEKYPTSGVAVFTIDGAWGAVAPGTATLAQFAAPRG